MNIVLHCGGMPFNGDTLKTKSLGGSESAAYYMAKELAAQGHRVMLFTNHAEGGNFDGVHYTYAGNITQQAPFGERFHLYAINTQHDLLIMQRHPQAFRFPWQAKVKLWWLHDLAMGRARDEVHKMLWNTDGILCVSEWHRQQVIKTWGLSEDIVFAIQNGVDLSLYNKTSTGDLFARYLSNFDNTSDVKELLDTFNAQFKLLYTSRPERGLLFLLKEGGIMEQLKTMLPSAHLYLATYDNPAHQLQELYSYLDGRVKVLGNVTRLGNLTKQELADVQRQSDLYVYPTMFEDTSCITMMECMAAGLPVLASKVAVLPETCREPSGCVLLDNDTESPVIDYFVTSIRNYDSDRERLAELKTLQLEAANKFDWSIAAKMVLDISEGIFAKLTANKTTLAKHYIHMSDVYAADTVLKDLAKYEAVPDSIVNKATEEIVTCYEFALSNNWKDHYERYYQYEKDRGVVYGPENISGNLRFECVADYVNKFCPANGLVVDYGCAHGHYTINLAKRFPDRRFVGVDITQSNIDTARKWAAEDGIKNVEFYCEQVQELSNGTWTLIKSGDTHADVLISAEVLEHVEKPGELAAALQRTYLKSSGHHIMTTPYGPWEAEGYDQHWPWRAHVHHLERDDLNDLFGHWPWYTILGVSSGLNKMGEILGSYVVTTGHVGANSPGAINYDRKNKLQAPKQTLSVCMIVKNGESDLRRCLDSVKGIADEIIICVDATTTDNTMDVIKNFKSSLKTLWPVVKWHSIQSPMVIGFDAARNESISHASGDWIMWIDADEVLTHGENLKKYLRNNTYKGYAVKQHHFSVEPLGVQQTDIPCRVFRNNIGIKFFGLVHEHPETEFNKSVQPAMLIPDIDIAHYGYSTDAVRTGRFERNINLLVADRHKYPDRKLGKFLWLRDLAHMCKFEIQKTGVISDAMLNRAKSGISLYEGLIDDLEIPSHLILAGLEYYSLLVQIVDPEAQEVGFSVDVSKLNGGAHPENNVFKGHFLSSSIAGTLMARLLKEKAGYYETKYF